MPVVIREALRARRSARRGQPLILELAGGRGALLSRAAARDLVTVLPAADAPRLHGTIQTWLERRQAKRSALLLAPDRGAAISAVRTLGVDLARVRLVDDAGHIDEATIAEGLATARHRRAARQPWHSR